MATITTLEGIGPSEATRLRGIGVRTVEALLDTAADRKGRRAVAEATGLEEGSILSWVNVVVAGWVAQARDLPPAVTH